MALETAVFIGLSVDGFIARPDGGLDWLTGAAESPDSAAGEDYGYERFIAGIDALVMGRKTYETVLGFGDWPYGTRRVVVVSSSPERIEVPSQLADRVETTAATPMDIVAALESRGFRRAYLDGGRLIQSFLSAGLVDELILTRVPVLIGEGIPLFGPTPQDIRLDHLETRAFASGAVQSRYRLSRPAPGP